LTDQGRHIEVDDEVVVLECGAQRAKGGCSAQPSVRPRPPMIASLQGILWEARGHRADRGTRGGGTDSAFFASRRSRRPRVASSQR
jgi:hypothetical protein